MGNDQEQPVIEKEKRINTKLAAVVGIIGIGSIGFFYVIVFLVTIFRPGLRFSIMPTPEIDLKALSDGEHTYIFYEGNRVLPFAEGHQVDDRDNHTTTGWCRAS
jgi:hypothetical protein